MIKWFKKLFSRKKECFPIKTLRNNYERINKIDTKNYNGKNTILQEEFKKDLLSNYGKQISLDEYSLSRLSNDAKRKIIEIYKNDIQNKIDYIEKNFEKNYFPRGFTALVDSGID